MFSPFLEFIISTFGLKAGLKIVSAAMANICVCGFLLRRLIPNANRENVRNNKKIDRDDRTMRKTMNVIFKTIAKDFNLYLFTKVRFIFQSVINGFLWGGNNAFLIYLYPYSVSVGVSGFQSSFLLSICGISLLFVRLLPIGHLVDKKLISAGTIAGIGWLACGSIMIVASFMRTFTSLSIIASLHGCTLGIAGSFTMVVVAYCGGSKEKASGAISWLLLQNGTGSLVCTYLCGKSSVFLLLCHVSGPFRTLDKVFDDTILIKRYF